MSEFFLCPKTGSEHRIGYNAVDAGHGARPSGPQICLHCRKPLKQLIQAHIDEAVRRTTREQELRANAYSRTIMRVYDGEEIEVVEPEEMRRADKEIAQLTTQPKPSKQADHDE